MKRLSVFSLLVKNQAKYDGQYNAQVHAVIKLSKADSMADENLRHTCSKISEVSGLNQHKLFSYTKLRVKRHQ
jgi:hypothetical protein